MDFEALQQALREASERGDREAMRRLASQLDVDELPTLDPGELRRVHFRGAPPQLHLIIFSPADAPPPTYPAGLPWLRGAKTSVLVFGPGEPLQVHWSCADAGAAADQIVAESLADGWTEPPGFRFPTATGARVVYFERPGLVRILTAAAGTGQGMVQMTQSARRSGAASSDAAPQV